MWAKMGAVRVDSKRHSGKITFGVADLSKVSGHHDIVATLIHLNDEKPLSIRRDS